MGDWTDLGAGKFGELTFEGEIWIAKARKVNWPQHRVFARPIGATLDVIGRPPPGVFPLEDFSPRDPWTDEERGES